MASIASSNRQAARTAKAANQSLSSNCTPSCEGIAVDELLATCTHRINKCAHLPSPEFAHGNVKNARSDQRSPTAIGAVLGDSSDRRVHSSPRAITRPNSCDLLVGWVVAVQGARNHSHALKFIRVGVSWNRTLEAPPTDHWNMAERHRTWPSMLPYGPNMCVSSQHTRETSIFDEEGMPASSCVRRSSSAENSRCDEASIGIHE